MKYLRFSALLAVLSMSGIIAPAVASAATTTNAPTKVQIAPQLDSVMPPLVQVLTTLKERVAQDATTIQNVSAQLNASTQILSTLRSQMQNGSTSPADVQGDLTQVRQRLQSASQDLTTLQTRLTAETQLVSQLASSFNTVVSEYSSLPQ